MAAYIRNAIHLEFLSDRILTDTELDTLRSMIALQVEEPQDLEGNQETWTAQDIVTNHSVIVREGN